MKTFLKKIGEGILSPPRLMKKQIRYTEILEDELCLDTVLHIVVRSSGSLGVEVSDISLQLQIVLVEVVGNGADLLGLEVIAYITVWIKHGITECNADFRGNHVACLAIVADCIDSRPA